jgi:hypothetical protein
MRIDKAVLTVIAACLVWMSLGGPAVLTPVSAQTSKPEIVLEIVVSKSGSDILKTVIRTGEGGTGVIHLADGTEVKLTPRLSSQ